MQYKWRLIIEREDGSVQVLDGTKDELCEYRSNPGEKCTLVRDRRGEPNVGSRR